MVYAIRDRERNEGTGQRQDHVRSHRRERSYRRLSFREAGNGCTVANASAASFEKGDQIMRALSLVIRAATCAAIPIFSATSQTPQATVAIAPKVDSETISGLGARNIGSAAMSGRVAAIAAVHEGNRLTVYIGAASGGVWKSANGGTTYKPVFDKQTVQSIGAIAIDPTNPKVVWVGTGESWTRNSVSIGDGIYKTTDGGEN